MRHSKILKKLRNGDTVIIPHVWTIGHWKIVDIMGVIGFDAVWIENEHSDFTYSELSQMILACRAHDMDAIVRVQRYGYTGILKVLEAGATGIIVPHTMDGMDAKSIVDDAKFSPLGMRGQGGSVDTGYGMANQWDEEYLNNAMNETVVIAQIEDKKAVENVENIADAKGIDILFVGPADLSQSYGVLGQLNHKHIVDAMEATAAACNKHGKWWGAPAFDSNQVRTLIKRGARFIEYGSEQSALVKGLQDVKNLIDEIT